MNNTTEISAVARAALEYIDAIPPDIAAQLPTMPGFDREWAEEVIASHTNAVVELRAGAVDAFAEYMRSKIGNPAFNDAAHSYAARRANAYAKKLRVEASK